MRPDLRGALLDANLRQYQETMERAAEPAFTPRYRKSCLRMLASPNAWARRFARPLWKKILQTAACILLACTLALGALMGASPTVRAAVKNWFRELCGEKITYMTTTHGITDGMASLYRPAVLPRGWVVTRMQSDGYDCQWNYENGDRWMLFRCIGPSPSEEQNGPGASQAIIHGADETLSGSRQTLTIQGCLADFYEDGENTLLTWENEAGLLFWLRAKGIAQEELVDIAQQIQPYQGPIWEVQADWLPVGYSLVPSRGTAVGDSGQLEWRQERNTITCAYSGTAPLQLPEGAAESADVNGTEAYFWSGQGPSTGPTLLVDGQVVGGNSVVVSDDCTVSVGGGNDVDSVEKNTLSWTDPVSGISIRISGPVSRETLLHMAENFQLKPVSEKN